MKFSITELKVISELESILASSQKLMGIIKKELHEISEKYSDKRKTQVADITLEESELDVEDLIEKEEMVITVTNAGYIKRTPVKLYKEQRRGGKGIIAATTKEEDFISAVFTARCSFGHLFCNQTFMRFYNRFFHPNIASRIRQNLHIKFKLAVEGLNVSLPVYINKIASVRNLKTILAQKPLINFHLPLVRLPIFVIH